MQSKLERLKRLTRRNTKVFLNYRFQKYDLNIFIRCPHVLISPGVGLHIDAVTEKNVIFVKIKHVTLIHWNWIIQVLILIYWADFY